MQRRSVATAARQRHFAVDSTPPLEDHCDYALTLIPGLLSFFLLVISWSSRPALPQFSQHVSVETLKTPEKLIRVKIIGQVDRWLFRFQMTSRGFGRMVGPHRPRRRLPSMPREMCIRSQSLHSASTSADNPWKTLSVWKLELQLDHIGTGNRNVQ